MIISPIFIFIVFIYLTMFMVIIYQQYMLYILNLQIKDFHLEIVEFKKLLEMKNLSMKQIEIKPVIIDSSWFGDYFYPVVITISGIVIVGSIYILLSYGSGNGGGSGNDSQIFEKVTKTFNTENITSNLETVMERLENINIKIDEIQKYEKIISDSYKKIEYRLDLVEIQNAGVTQLPPTYLEMLWSHNLGWKFPGEGQKCLTSCHWSWMENTNETLLNDIVTEFAIELAKEELTLFSLNLF